MRLLVLATSFTLAAVAIHLDQLVVQAYLFDMVCPTKDYLSTQICADLLREMIAAGSNG